MLPAIDRIDTILVTVATMAAGVAGLIVLPVGMRTSTIVLMVLPAMVMYGAIMLVVGVAHGQYRAEA